MEIPQSMRAQLGAWNNRAGIDLKSWVGCEGSLSLAIGYTTIFWPEFVLFDGYILPKGFSEKSLRGFEQRPNINRKSVEWVMNHVHILDLHARGRMEASADQIVALGNVLAEIYATKLRVQFPDLPCTVEFFKPDNDDAALVEYQLSFWQKCHDSEQR